MELHNVNWYNKSGSLVNSAYRLWVKHAAELEVARELAGAFDAFASLSMAANSEVKMMSRPRL